MSVGWKIPVAMTGVALIELIYCDSVFKEYSVEAYAAMQRPVDNEKCLKED